MSEWNLYVVTIPVSDVFEVTARDEEEARKFALNDLQEQVRWIGLQDLAVERMEE